jgi:hypothetical protein
MGHEERRVAIESNEPSIDPATLIYVRREATRAGIRAVAATVAYFVLPFDESWLIGSLLVVLLIVGLVPFTIRRFGRVLRSEHVVGDAVSALVMTLVTLVLTFAAAYYVFAQHDATAVNGLSTKLDALYFETTMLTTVGFGDVSAASQGARAVATVNMVMNTIFLGTSIRLLTWAVQHHHDTEEPPATGQAAP